VRLFGHYFLQIIDFVSCRALNPKTQPWSFEDQNYSHGWVFRRHMLFRSGNTDIIDNHTTFPHRLQFRILYVWKHDFISVRKWHVSSCFHAHVISRTNSYKSGESSLETVPLVFRMVSTLFHLNFQSMPLWQGSSKSDFLGEPELRLTNTPITLQHWQAWYLKSTCSHVKKSQIWRMWIMWSRPPYFNHSKLASLFESPSTSFSFAHFGGVIIRSCISNLWQWHMCIP